MVTGSHFPGRGCTGVALELHWDSLLSATPVQGRVQNIVHVITLLRV
jgi:hypothetical protein